MSRSVYRPRILRISVEDAKADALAFLADPSHEAYAGRLEVDHVAETIASCCGAGGPNIDYLAKTLRHLEALGLRESRLHAIWRAVERRATARQGDGAADRQPKEGK